MPEYGMSPTRLVCAGLVLTSVVTAPLAAQAPGAPASDAALAHARALLASTPLVDGHNDLPWAIRESSKAPRDVDAYDLSAYPMKGGSN